jgi:hypothetical protein
LFADSKRCVLTSTTDFLRNSLPTTNIQMACVFECRVCFEEDDEEQLIAPCSCKGTSKFIHKACLKMWIEASRNNKKCPSCKSAYNGDGDLTLNLSIKERIVPLLNLFAEVLGRLSLYVMIIGYLGYQLYNLFEFVEWFQWKDMRFGCIEVLGYMLTFMTSLASLTIASDVVSEDAKQLYNYLRV